MYYATRNADGRSIAKNADIREFATEAQARDYLLSAYGGGEWDMASAVIAPGSFGDCWIKARRAPAVGESILAPFAYSQVYIQRPGQHPGGKEFWLTPLPDVLVVAEIREIEDSE